MFRICFKRNRKRGLYKSICFCPRPSSTIGRPNLTKLYSKPEFPDMEIVPKSTRRGDIYKKGQHHTFIHQSTKKYTEDCKTGLKKDMAILEISRNQSMDVPDSEIVVNEETKKNYTHVTCIVNSCQGKVAVLFGNMLWHWW